MNEPAADLQCRRCGQAMQRGAAVSRSGGRGTRPIDRGLVFVVPGTPTSLNPVTAFQQGLEEEPANQAYLIEGWRCPHCGVVELFALDPLVWDP